MTIEEFSAWRQETIQSEHQWTVDDVFSHNRKCHFIYKGGNSGSYIQINNDGLVQIGTYENAFPHIGEAMFKKIGEQKYNDKNDALENLYHALGSKFLIELFFSTLNHY